MAYKPNFTKARGHETRDIRINNQINLPDTQTQYEKNERLFRLLREQEVREQALSFYSIRGALNTPAANATRAFGFDLGSILRGQPTADALAISRTLEEQFGLITELGDGRLKAMYVPTAAFARDLAVASTVGAEVVQTSVHKSLVEVLRPRCTVLKAGATVLENLKSNVTIAAQATTVDPVWLAENDSATPDAQDFTFSIQGTLTPKRAQSSVIVSRTLLQQSSVAIAQTVLRDLADNMAVALDKACLLTGSEAPTGLTGISGTLPIAMTGAVTWSKLISAEQALENQNVVDDGTVAWITSPDAKAKWKTATRSTNSSLFIWGDDNRVSSFPAYATRQLASGNQAILGRFSDVLVGLFGGLIVVTDPYTLAHLNKTVIHTTLLCDVVARHANSFVVSSDSAAQ
jgi:HK97 family phage major capsid protein